jgi:hypothetical protein
MTANEKRLLRIFAVTAVSFAFAGVAYTGVDRIFTAEASIKSYAKALSKLPQSEYDANEIDARIRELRKSIESAPSVEAQESLPAFAAEVRSLLSRHRIDPAQYQVVGASGDEALEFTLKCETAAFLRFLKEASDARRGWDLPFIAIRPVVEGSISEITIRVKHAK